MRGILRVLRDQFIDPKLYFMKSLPLTLIKYPRRRLLVKKLLNRYLVRGKIQERFNVVFILIDCLRWDHTSMANYNRDTTPFIKKLSEKGLLFTNSYAAAPWTFPSIISLLTGCYPRTHGGVYRDKLRYFIRSGLPDKPRKEVLYISEILKSFDYQILLASDIHTTALAIYKREPHYFPYIKGGFDPSTLFARRVIDFQKNFFLYLHLGDLHIPVQVPESFQTAFGRIDRSIPNLSTWSYCSGNMDSSGFIQYKRNRIKMYDAAIRYADHIVKNIVTQIEEASEYPTIFIITADHGEELWDHAQMEKKLFYDPRRWWGVGHGHNLFQEIIKVPLIFYGGKVPTGIRKENVSLVDVFPTILDLLSIDHRIPCDGRTLLSTDNETPILSEEVAYGYEKKTIVQENYKLIVSEGDSVQLLFDLKNDPFEKAPIENPSLEKHLKTLIYPKKTERGKKQKTTQEIQKRLQELGYF